MSGISMPVFAVFLALAPWLAIQLAAEEIQGASYWGSREVVEKTDPPANVLHEASASFFWEEQLYQLQATPDASRSAQQVLVDAMAELAPGLSLACFHRWTLGTWDDLAAAGLGDPRPFVPAGYASAGMALTYYAAPAKDCPDGVAAEIWPTQFLALFRDPAGSRLELRAEWFDVPAGAPPGVLSSSQATWTRAPVAFSVAFDDPAAGEATVANLAHALDPTFQKDCSRRVYEGSAAHLSAYGVNPPAVPPGFLEVTATQTVRAAPAGCLGGQPSTPEVEAAWVFAAGTTFLEAGATRKDKRDEDPSLNGVLVGEGFVRWTDTEGITYYVYSHDLEEGPPLSQEALFAVARSLDPEVVLPEP